MEKKYIMFIIAMAISFLTTPIVRKFAKHIKAIDIPKDKRRVHKKPIPKIGGLAIYLAFVLVLVLKKGHLEKAEMGIIFGGGIIVLGGFIDDLKCLRPLYKVLFQLLGAFVLIGFGLRISMVTNPLSNSFSYIHINNFIGIAITIIWIIGVTNAFNLIDGLDGLSAGVGFISSVTIAIVAFLNGPTRSEAEILSVILAGSILGFLPYNFNPASIFMGDTGAQFLGFALAAISIQGAIKSASAVVLAVPILVLGLPIYDTIFAIIRRKINGKPITQADRGHLHHRLLDMGLSQKQAVLIMYFISAIMGLVAVIAMQLTNTKAYVIFAGAVICIVGLAWKFGLFKHK
ncbi:UDP-GlcNAc:undecaprenyl-phosphate GlcNAc-1-phosphate transferase [Clostridium acetobutylicum]|uniref:Undecaprenyl-phosphate n=1 Tax=Clostridium acetobutylicum (strain ATCC 824 / DSM 792 / JCM 1419 / IAM 19013 / LMG 5710 / NBRC 13948 / NRRL B-527 / VKM B-1787 / 2291 / W) TaxID=272562 RepID=Q97F77_CLOAB|nr:MULTISPECIES: MraY family glycosyltransferase [Clostridium]AAK80818.1 Undecaprenyl-phosphate [Clostridium acetobutylicum ATCC 824]ADZ21919.1 Undecaprenyl-phosphate [Clostridium acetobutylicum EA 2018]AEI33085.1 undecaprenyl-phosphate [Clostridium acetobutylicum DSM 1731]AWV78770.1 undecaprenyl/decaprenyl-phosphate alpha-N-acetylglucosaminyl 1-phosphate transferase [Clostridium acetobutylicum]KHD37179.1 glycosyl transferase [Clostridium acetobutylicum]